MKMSFDTVHQNYKSKPKNYKSVPKGNETEPVYSESEPKGSGTEAGNVPVCTRGVKCILVHLLVTAILLLVLIVVYVVHILVVKHRGWEAVRVSRRNLYPTLNEDSQLLSKVSAGYSVGGVFVDSSPARVICSCVLLRATWSLAPAHCVTIRADPDHSPLLPSWKIRYKDDRHRDTDIKKGLVHSYFNKDDFDNNIGLFEHLDKIELPTLKFSNKVVSDLSVKDTDVEIFGWSKVDKTFYNKARVLDPQHCLDFVKAIVDAPRSSELCIIQYVDENKIDDDVHGAALILDSEVVGFFSWGDRSGEATQVGLIIAPYTTWIQEMMDLESSF